MPVIRNPREYDQKVPTNVRLVRELKAYAKAEAKSRNIDLADVVNESLAERYKGRVERVTEDTSGNLG